MLRDFAVAAVSAALGIALIGCGDQDSIAACYQVKFDNGELPLTFNGSEIDYSIACNAGFAWDQGSSVKVQCNWVDRECLASENETCMDVFGFTKPGEGLVDWPSDKQPTIVEKFPENAFFSAGIAQMQKYFRKGKEAAKKTAGDVAATAGDAAAKAKDAAGEAAAKAKGAAGDAVAKAKSAAGDAAAKAKDAAGDAGKDETAAAERRLGEIPKQITPEDLKAACKAKKKDSNTTNTTKLFQIFGSASPASSSSVGIGVFAAFAAAILLAIGCVVHSKTADKEHSFRLSETHSDSSIDEFVE